jgi:hypothetical protein
VDQTGSKRGELALIEIIRTQVLIGGVVLQDMIGDYQNTVAYGIGCFLPATMGDKSVVLAGEVGDLAVGLLGALDVGVSPTGAVTQITPVSGLSAPARTLGALPWGLCNHYAAMAVARPAPFVVHPAGALAVGARVRATLCT